MRVFFMFLLFLCSSCGKRDQQYYCREAEAIQSRLYREISSIETIQDLLSKKEILSLLFQQLASLTVEAYTFQQSKGIPAISPSRLSQELVVEIVRVLKIPGAQTILELSQEKGLEIIDQFEKEDSRLRLRGTDSCCARAR